MAGEQLALELGHVASHAEDDFLVGEGNKAAHGHVLAFPHWPAPLTLVLGPPKSGKSHLARIFADRSGAEIVSPDSAERLATQGGLAPLVIEDLDRVAYEEEALFHLLNQSMREGRPVLMTAREPVSQWPYKTADLLSRARLAADFTLALTDDVQLAQIFAKLFGDRQVTVDPKVVAYLVARMERSPQEAVIMVELMDRLALARGTAITRAVAAEALAMRGAATDQFDQVEEAGDE